MLGINASTSPFKSAPAASRVTIYNNGYHNLLPAPSRRLAAQMAPLRKAHPHLSPSSLSNKNLPPSSPSCQSATASNATSPPPAPKKSTRASPPKLQNPAKRQTSAPSMNSPPELLALGPLSAVSCGYTLRITSATRRSTSWHYGRMCWLLRISGVSGWCLGVRSGGGGWPVR